MTFRLEDGSEWSGWKGFWILTFDLEGEKVNKFNRKVTADFEKVLIELEDLGRANKIEALAIRSGKPGQFVAGADLDMVLSVTNVQEAEVLSRTGQKLLDRFEDLPFPTVAWVAGPALGGGCELTLACRATVMSSDLVAKIGLPEVMLGLLPGMGGCVRLPQKVGIATALDLILSGKQLNGERAYKAGLVEALIPKENFEISAVRWMRSNIEALKNHQRLGKAPKLGGMGGVIGSALEGTPMGRAFIFQQARKGVLAKTRGHYPAPLEAISVICDAYGRNRTKAMEREARGFGKLAAGETSKHLIRLFFMTEKIKKSSGLERPLAQALPVVSHGSVLGAGIMGGGIAQLMADKGLTVRMKDLNEKALNLGVQAASQLFQKQVKRRRLTRRQAQQKLGLITPTLTYEGLNQTQIVIEAVVENLDLKKKVFSELEGFVSDDCVIVSNTSSLSITEMQKALKKPERFAGMHFFNPVHKMPLIEVIRGEKSSDETVSMVYELSKKLGKMPVVVKDAPGFLVNRLLLPYLSEATYLLSEGAPVEELDRVLLEFGMPMGPLELIDEVGIDVGEKVAHILFDAFGERVKPSEMNAKALKAGLLGKKNGKGFYRYEGKNKRFDSSLYQLLGISPQPGKIKSQEILERCVFSMINEASRCLTEGVVLSAHDVDLAMIMGTGFPPFRGGLLRYADTLGLSKIIDCLREYEKTQGIRFRPAEALIHQQEKYGKFYP